MNLETKITIYKFTPQLFTLTPGSSIAGIKAQFENGSDSTDPENLGESLTPIDICLYSCLQTYSLTLI